MSESLQAAERTSAFERWRTEGRTFRHRSHEIFFRVAGEGPALLLLHGFPSASWDWQPMWAELSARFRVIAADMLGFGWSDKPRPYRYSIMDQASLQQALLRELGVERVHVLAHDYGDTVAQELLARHEEGQRREEASFVIQSLCFLNGGLFPEAHRPRVIQKLLASPIGFLVSRAITKRSLAAGLAAIFGPRTQPSAQLIDELWALLRHQHGQRIAHLLIGYMAERRLHRDRWVGVLQRTSVPLRLIDGLVDPVSGAHLVARYRELLPDADAVELPDIGHYPQIEDARAVLDAFFGFHARIAGCD